MSGKRWERAIALENQALLEAGRAMVSRVPTHYHGGAPSHDPKVDFVGLLRGGRMVAIEAKADGGGLSDAQRAYLSTVARMGGIALVYRHVGDQRHVCLVTADGRMQKRGAVTHTEAETWLDALVLRALVIEVPS